MCLIEIQSNVDATKSYFSITVTLLIAFYKCCMLNVHVDVHRQMRIYASTCRLLLFLLLDLPCNYRIVIVISQKQTH